MDTYVSASDYTNPLFNDNGNSFNKMMCFGSVGTEANSPVVESCESEKF